MSGETRKPVFDFSHWLTPDEQEMLCLPANWRWISSDMQKNSISHPRHRSWMKVRGNTHSPAHRQAMLTFRGSAVHSLDGRIYERRPGTVMLFDHHEIRDLKGAAHKKNFHCLWLHFYSRESLTYNSNSCDKRGRYFQEIPTGMKSGSQVRRMMEVWDQCMRDPEDAMCRALLYHLLAGTFLDILVDTGAREPGNHQAEVVESVQSYINNHLGDDLSLHALAQIAGYSPYFFHRLFVQHTGQTPVQYITTMRLELAKELLRKNYRVQAVAECVGFSSLSYFNSFFKKHLLLSPRSWSVSHAKDFNPPAGPTRTRESKYFVQNHRG